MLTESLQDFLINLRREGFKIGADTVLDIERAIRSFALHGGDLSEPVDMEQAVRDSLSTPFDLMAILSPIVCNSKSEQERFPVLYRAWWARDGALRERSAKEAARSAHEALVVDQSATDKVDRPVARALATRRWLTLASGFALALVIIAALMAVPLAPPEYDEREVQPTDQGTELQDGQITEIPQAEDSKINIDNILALVIRLITIDNDQIFRLLLALLPLLIPPGYLWFNERSIRALQRRFTIRTPQSTAVTFETAKQLLFSGPSAERTFQSLRQHRAVEGTSLDIQRTLRSVVQSGGLGEAHFRFRRVLPELALLVARECEEDHLRGVADLLEVRLRQSNAPVLRFEFTGLPQRLMRRDFFTGEFRESLSLTELAARYGEQRLVIIGDASRFVSPLTFRLNRWGEQLIAWERRAILTAKPESDWGRAEDALAEAEFIVAHATTKGLEDMAHWFAVEEGLEVAPDLDEHTTLIARTYPPLLSDDPWRWLEEESPSASALHRLLDELYVYLGEAGFFWLAACAAFPKIHPELTLHLGAVLQHDDAPLCDEEGRFLALSRLPWFQRGFMPDWLRVALLHELSPQRREVARRALTDVLLTARGGIGTGLVLSISDQSTVLAARVIERFQLDKGGENPLREEIFLSVLRGREPPPLGLIAPRSFWQVVRRRISLDQVVLWGVSAVLVLGIWMLDPWRRIGLAISWTELLLIGAAAFGTLAVGYSVVRFRRTLPTLLGRALAIAQQTQRIAASLDSIAKVARKNLADTKEAPLEASTRQSETSLAATATVRAFLAQPVLPQVWRLAAIMFFLSVGMFLLLEINIESVAINVLGPYTSEEQRSIWLEANGYNDPPVARYLRWSGNFILGDFGESIRFKVPVSEVLWPRLANSLVLIGAVLPVIIGVVFFAIMFGSRTYLTGPLLFQAAASMPVLVTVILGSAIFVFYLDALPGTSSMSEGFDFSQLILPILALAIPGAGYFATKIWITSQAISYPPKTRFEVFPYRSFQACQFLIFSWLVSALVIVEYNFAFKGLGALFLEAALNRDIFLMEACVLVLVLVALIGQILVGLIDPVLVRILVRARHLRMSASVPKAQVPRADRYLWGLPLSAMLGACIILFWVLIAIFADITTVISIPPFGPNATLAPLREPLSEWIVDAGAFVGNQPVEAVDFCSAILGEAGAASSKFDCGVFWLGTDHLGRDTLSRLIWGAQRMMIHAIPITAGACFVGVLLAKLTSLFQLGATTSPSGQTRLPVPSLIVYVVVIASIGTASFNIAAILLIGTAVGATIFFRDLGRQHREGSLKGEMGRGLQHWTILADVLLRFGSVVLALSVLGFLGLGLPPPEPDWGGMINETRQMLLVFPHMAVAPALALASLLFGIRLLGAGFLKLAMREVYS